MPLNELTYHYMLSPSTMNAGNYSYSAVYFQYVSTDFIFELINSIQMKYNFKTFILFITLKLEADYVMRFVKVLRKDFPNVTKIIISDNNHRKYSSMSGLLSKSVLNIVFTTNDDDPIMGVAAKSLRGIRYLRTMFVLYPQLERTDYYAEFKSHVRFMAYVRSIFEFIWKRQFTNTILLSISETIFILDPYPKLNIIEKKYDWNVDDFFTRSSIDDVDWKGYVIDTPIQYDLPRVFPLAVQHTASGNSWLSGSSALFFEAFTRMVNATVVDSSAYILDPAAFNFEYILHRIVDESIEISLHSFTFLVGTPVTASYPIGINDFCIMVPYRNRFPDHLYLPSTFSYLTWLMIIFGCFYVSVTLWICTPSKSRDYSASLLQAICTILCIVPTLMLQSSNLRTRYLFILLFLLGFITSQIFVCRMASYLTTSPEERQIDTIDDIMAAKLKIMILQLEYDTILDLADSNPKFLNHIKIVDKPTLNLYRDNLNTSYGYSVTTDRWNFLNKQQRFLRKPVFRLSKVCNGPYFHAFPMKRDSHLDLSLKYFVMLVQQSGFMEAWEDRSFADALHLKYVTILKGTEELRQLTVDFFLGIWIICGFGYTLAFVVFLMEIKWSLMKKIFIKLLTKLWKMLCTA